MRNFTLLLAAVIIAFSAMGQSKTTVQKWHKKNANINKERIENAFPKSNINLMLSIPESLNQESILKHAATKEKLDSIVTIEYNSVTQKWENDWKDEFIYDASKRLKETYEREWDDAAGNWKLIGKSVLTYNPAGQITKMNVFDIDNDDGLIKSSSRIDYFYSASGRLDSAYVYSTEDGNTWELSSKNYYTYNNTGQVSQSVTWVYDDEEEEWLTAMKSIFSYSTTGKQTEFKMYMNFEDEDVLFFQTQYTWNASGKLLSEKSSALSFLTFSMEKSDSLVYSYNTSGDQSKVVEYLWKKDKTSWEPESQEEFLYGNLNFSDVIFPYVGIYFIFDLNPDLFNFQKAIVEVQGSKYENGAFTLKDKSRYFYSGTTSAPSENLEQNRISIFPNPATDKVTFSWNMGFDSMNLMLYQITGSKVMEKEIFSHEAENLEHLDRGVYVYKLIDKQNLVQTGKIILK